MPDPTRPDSNRPDANRSDSNRSDSNRSDTTRSDSNRSDTTRSDSSGTTPTGTVPSASAQPTLDQPGWDSSAPDAVDRRLTDLEIKATYADDLLDQLNQTIYRQQAEIDQLARALKALREQMPDLENRAGPGLLDEVPPHY